jgi:psiF repeat
MRMSIAAAALCLSLWPFAGIAADPPPAGTPAKSSAAGSPAVPSGDAAARHAKRTACLKDAKTKKLVGAEKTAFVKSCTAAP